MGLQYSNKPPLQYAAKNGLLDRREFLRGGLLFSAFIAAPAVVKADESGSLLSKPAWMKQPGKPFSSYGVVSQHESKVVRMASANAALPSNGAAWSPLHQLEGMITPNGLHYERHHNGVPDIDPDKHRLFLHGMVDRPISFATADLLRYPRRSQICFIECGGNSNSSWNKRPVKSAVGYTHGLVSCSEWTGVSMSILLAEAGVKKGARWLIAEGADAFAMNMSVPLEKILDDAMLALFQNGERLRPEQGYPMRLLVPGWEGVLHVKWLRRIQLSDRPVMARNETAKYTELLPSGKAEQFSMEMVAKSLITSPVSGSTVPQHGLFQITGLAWSGRGKVAKVEVSADNGESWAEAALEEPILAKAFTRFRIPWHWQGKAAFLKSRVTDESGYVQPEREKLIAERGRHGYFHYNAIMTLAVSKDGSVEHVYGINNANTTKNSDSVDINADW
ncbi:Sulfur oxidation molybdopterin C protein [uncultured Candidatus Thioglobus sp.]|nr:Sulfur oxidation molybdopterin C protein [uncultured Candidatus Thioglobus sp.]